MIGQGSGVSHGILVRCTVAVHSVLDRDDRGEDERLDGVRKG